MEVKLKNLKSRFIYPSPIIKDEDTPIPLSLSEKIKIIIKLLIFIILTPLLSLFITFNTFNKILKIIYPSMWWDSFHVDADTFFIKRIILFIMVWMGTLFSFCIIFDLIIGNNKLMYTQLVYRFFSPAHLQFNYNWGKLKKSLEKYGYDPSRFKNGMIRIYNNSGNKNTYDVYDGNHRVALLKYLYDEDYKIKVKIVSKEYGYKFVGEWVKPNIVGEDLIYVPFVNKKIK